MSARYHNDRTTDRDRVLRRSSVADSIEMRGPWQVAVTAVVILAVTNGTPRVLWWWP